MKCTLNASGTITIKAENSCEAYALRKWREENELNSQMSMELNGEVMRFRPGAILFNESFPAQAVEGADSKGESRARQIEEHIEKHVSRDLSVECKLLSCGFYVEVIGPTLTRGFNLGDHPTATTISEVCEEINRRP